MKPVTLRQLVDHCSDLAQREIFVSGTCSHTFVAADPVGQLTVFVLPALDLSLLQAMLRAYCHAYETSLYAVTAKMWSRPVGEPEAARTEVVVITACSADEQVVWSREIKRGADGGVSFGVANEAPAVGGYLTDLLPPPMSSEERARHRQWWESNVARAMGVVFRHGSISNN